MWDNELLERARLQQIQINTAPQNAEISQRDLLREVETIVQAIHRLQTRKMIYKIVEDLENVSKKIKEFMNTTYETFLTKHPKDASLTTEKCVEDLRGAMYQMVHALSERNIKVSMTNPSHTQHITKIRGHLREISRALQDDVIELDVDMDTERDHEIAQRMQERFR